VRRSNATTTPPSPPTTNTPTLTSRLFELVHACFTGLYVEAREPEEAIRDITQLARRESWRLGIWDCDSGLAFPCENAPPVSPTDTNDPLAVLRSAGQLSTGAGTTLLVLQNFHRFLGATEILQAVQKQVLAGKHTRTFIVILAPVVNLPPEIEKQFIVVEHELPGREQLQEIATGIAQGDELPTGDENFQQLGGLENLKAFCLRAMRRQGEPRADRRPRGVLLLSPPGCGKSQFAKALGNETGRPTVVLDFGALLGSLVGQSESNVRAALKLADAMAPCVVFCDELEKALAGATSSGQTDSGVTARVFGSLLTWLNDHESDVFFVGTCNDASKLPPEFARAERFDGVFFVDLPGRDQKDAIWGIYQNFYRLDAKQARPDDTNWTGAEIKSCCRLASLLDVPLVQAAQNVVPVAVTAGDKIEALRQWASGRCLSADRAGVYSRSEVGSDG